MGDNKIAFETLLRDHKLPTWNPKKQPRTVLACLFSFLALLLLSQCIPISPSGNSSENGTPCPLLGLETPQKIQLSPTLFLVLVKGSPYNINNEYVPERYTEEALDNIEEIFPSAVMPGDRVMILLMEEDDIEDALVSNQAVKSMDPPKVSLSPTPFPTLTPSATPLPLTPSSFTYTLTEQAKPTYEAIINAAETERVYLDDCARKQWERANQENLITWKKQVEKETRSFWERMEHDLEENIQIDELEYGTQVYEALENASTLFANECANYARCVLLIFSDMEEFRSQTPDDVSIELQNVEVQIVFLHCNFVYLGTCQKWANFWTPKLESEYHAESINIMPNGDSMKSNLIDMLRRR